MLNQSETKTSASTIAAARQPVGMTGSAGEWVNDNHTQLNSTREYQVKHPVGLTCLQKAIRQAHRDKRSVCIAAGYNAMGGQQFGNGSLLLDMNRLNGLIEFDRDRGLIEVEAGMQWPALIHLLQATQSRDQVPWSIRQKQTGGDRMSIGGTLAANAHGRGLDFKPIVDDVESFTLLDANARVHHCSRTRNPELFRLAIGGYGLFGLITSVTLRLVPRRRLRRIVEIVDADALPGRFRERIEAGFLYGDFQFCTDPGSERFLREGVFSCYHPVAGDTPETAPQKTLSGQDWLNLIRLAHTDKGHAYERYSRYYLSTSGQLYESDTHQLSTYIDDYHRALGDHIGVQQHGTEMITEIYVPRDRLSEFLQDVRDDFRRHDVDLIYGTIRLIRRDEETFLAWAKADYACVIFNLHTQHDRTALQKTQLDFRRLIDCGIRYGGSYYLTYHRWASREQVEACYPQFPDFLRWKKALDPEERFQNDWYRHYREMFAGRV
mgnify:FL=1